VAGAPVPLASATPSRTSHPRTCQRSFAGYLADFLQESEDLPSDQRQVRYEQPRCVVVDLVPGVGPDVMAASARLEQKLGSNLAKVLVSLTALLYVSDYCRGMTGG